MFNYQEMRTHIDNRGLKQKRIADKAGISESTLSLILSGKRKCNIDEYVQLCASLEVPIGAFIMYKTSATKLAAK